VRNVSQQTTNITYRLDDGTGVVEVKVWIDPEADTSHKAPIVENSYVRAWGRLKAFGQKRHLGAHFIRPLQDMNEVNYHLLEATAVHLYFTKGPPGGDKANGQAGGGAIGGGADSHLPPGLSDAARKMYKVLRDTPGGNEGIHTHDIMTRTNLEMVDIQNAGQELLENGVAYNTLDDDTWSVMNPGQY